MVPCQYFGDREFVLCIASFLGEWKCGGKIRQNCAVCQGPTIWNSIYPVRRPAYIRVDEKCLKIDTMARQPETHQEMVAFQKKMSMAFSSSVVDGGTVGVMQAEWKRLTIAMCVRGSFEG